MKHDWQPDTELNERVAKALGWKQHPEYKHLWYGTGNNVHAQPLPNFCGDMTAAWIVVEHFKVCAISREEDGEWRCEIGISQWDKYSGIHKPSVLRHAQYSKSAPLAICMAALKALEK